MTIVAMQSLDQQRFMIDIQNMQIDNQVSDSPYPVTLSFEGSHKGKSVNLFKGKDTKLKSLNESKSSSNTLEPVLRFAAVKWRTRDASFVSYQRISIRYYLPYQCILFQILSSELLLTFFIWWFAV